MSKETKTAGFIRDRIAEVFASSQRYTGRMDILKGAIKLHMKDLLGEPGLPPEVRSLLHKHNWTYTELSDSTYHVFPKSEGHYWQ